MKGWIGIAAFVAVYDGWVAISKKPTLSADFCRASRAHPVVVGLGTAYIVAHLYGYWPKKIDPLCGYIKGGTLLVQKVKSAKAK